MPKIKYDMVQGFHGHIDQIPKKYRADVIAKFQAQNPDKNIKKYMLDIDVYISIDLRNSYRN